MSRQQANVILDAAERWKQRCLLDGGSLFTDERLWTRDRFEQLRVHVVENAHDGSDSFWKRLRRLIDPASPEAKRLWAEMTWAFYLIASEIPPERKRDQIARVWEWSGAALPEDHWALHEEVLTGCSHFRRRDLRRSLARSVRHRIRDDRLVLPAAAPTRRTLE